MLLLKKATLVPLGIVPLSAKVPTAPEVATPTRSAGVPVHPVMGVFAAIVPGDTEKLSVSKLGLLMVWAHSGPAESSMESATRWGRDSWRNLLIISLGNFWEAAVLENPLKGLPKYHDES